MAQYNPPSQNLPIFDSGLFGGTNSNPGSVPSGDFLNFPNAQGDENLLGITVADSATFNADSTFNNVVDINNDATFSTNLIMSGTYLTNYLEFPDGSQQFSASGGGDALLDGGNSTTPQTFTGYNEFSNADGQITLFNTTDDTFGDVKVSLSCDPLAYQLNIGGNLSIGNTANSNTIILSSAADYPGQLDIHGYLNIVNGTNDHAVNILTDATNLNQLNIQGALSIGNSSNSNSIILSSSVGASSTNPSLQIKGELLLVNYNNANFVQMVSNVDTANQLDINAQVSISNTTNSNTVIVACDSTNSDQLNITGALSTTTTINAGTTLTTGGDIYLNGLHLSKDVNTLGLNIIDAGITIGNTTNGNYSILSSDATTNQLLNITGDVAISTVQTYGTTYPDQNLATIKYVNGVTSSSLLGTNNTWTGTNAFNTSTPTTTITQTYPQASSTTQFATIGYVNTGISDATQYAALLNYGTSVSPQTFTSYNQINLLSFNGQSCAQKILNSSNSYATGSGSQWIWYNNIPYTLGNGFAFAFSTNNTPTAYTVSSNENLTPQANSVISGTGYAVYQPYVLSGTTYDAYIFNITGYCGTANLTAYTTANAQGTGKPQITIQTNDNNSFYLNIKMSLYIYPQAVV
jgi:hypothetical protein